VLAVSCLCCSPTVRMEDMQTHLADVSGLSEFCKERRVYLAARSEGPWHITGMKHSTTRRKIRCLEVGSLGDAFWPTLSCQMDARDGEAVPQMVLWPCESNSTFLLLTCANTRDRKGFLPPGAFRCIHSPYEKFKHCAKDKTSSCIL